MRGDCSIRIEGIGFTADEIAACAEREGLLSIEIELSAAPRCRCTDCISKNSPQPILSPKEISAVIDQARELGARRVILIDSTTGSYPHLHSLIDELYAKETQIELFAGAIEITTDFADRLFACRVAVDVEQDEAGQVDRLKAAGYGHPTAPRLSVRIPISADNIEQIPARWRLARSSGIVPHAQISTPNGSNNNPQTLPSQDRLRILFEQLDEIDRSEFDVPWNRDPALTGRSCKRHLFAVHVSACGTIYACVGVTIPLGNIRAESLRDIITLSEVLEDLRTDGQKTKEPCRTCSKTVSCYGCRGSAYQLTGDYLAGDQLCWKAESTVIQSLPVNVSQLIPHGPSIRMVDQLVQIGERRVSTNLTIQNDSPWIDEQGRLDDLAYIEIIAQSFAASHCFHLTPEQLSAHKGMLLGVTNLVISGEARAGQNLKIELQKVTRFGDFGIVQGEVRHEDGRLIATGQVKVWRPSEATALPMLHRATLGQS